MSKNRIVFTIGVISALIPFLGFPVKWEHFFFVIFGLILIFLTFSSAVKKRAGKVNSRSVDSYKETPTQTGPNVSHPFE